MQCGLIALDRSDKDYNRIEAFFKDGLRVFKEFVATEAPGKYEAENGIWRARILNNLGLVSMARGYLQSERHSVQAVYQFEDPAPRALRCCAKLCEPRR